MDSYEEEIIEIDDTEVIDDNGISILCLVGNQEAWIEKEQLSEYSEVREKGDVGILVIPNWVIDELELIV